MKTQIILALSFSHILILLAIVIGLILLIRFLIRTAIPFAIKNLKTPKTAIIFIAGISLFLMIALLPFHYFWRSSNWLPRIYSKDQLSFKNTFIGQGDVDELLERYNKANLYEKISIKNEPLFKLFLEKNLIREEQERPKDD